ncbi:MAG: hypothetical protein U0792_18330 [Gemmataceae bacterium]
MPATSKTPTFAAVRLEIENRCWHGVPFYLRSGKGLEEPLQRSDDPVPLPVAPDVSAAGWGKRCNHHGDDPANEGIKLNFQTKVPNVDGVTSATVTSPSITADAYKEKALPEAC